MAGQAASTGGRLYSFCGINIDWDYAIEEMHRCLGELGMKGVKMHFQYQDTDVTAQEAKLDEIYDVLAQYGVPALIHPPFHERGHNWTLFRLSLRNPNTVIIWAHALSDDVRTIERYAAYYKNWEGPRNLYLETSLFDGVTY